MLDIGTETQSFDWGTCSLVELAACRSDVDMERCNISFQLDVVPMESTRHTRRVIVGTSGNHHDVLEDGLRSFRLVSQENRRNEWMMQST